MLHIRVLYSEIVGYKLKDKLQSNENGDLWALGISESELRGTAVRDGIDDAFLLLSFLQGKLPNPKDDS